MAKYLDQAGVVTLWSKIKEKIAEAQSMQLKVEVVMALPSTGETNVLYLVSKAGSTNDIYDEYLYVSDTWEHIGSTEVDLSEYMKLPDNDATERNGGYVLSVSSDDTSKNVWRHVEELPEVQPGTDAGKVLATDEMGNGYTLSDKYIYWSTYPTYIPNPDEKASFRKNISCGHITPTLPFTDNSVFYNFQYMPEFSVGELFVTPPAKTGKIRTITSRISYNEGSVWSGLILETANNGSLYVTYGEETRSDNMETVYVKKLVWVKDQTPKVLAYTAFSTGDTALNDGSDMTSWCVGSGYNYDTTDTANMDEFIAAVVGDTVVRNAMYKADTAEENVPSGYINQFFDITYEDGTQTVQSPALHIYMGDTRFADVTPKGGSSGDIEPITNTELQNILV